MSSLNWTLLLTFCLLDTATCQGTNDNVTEARLFLEEFNTNYGIEMGTYYLKYFILLTNYSAYNGQQVAKHETQQKEYLERMEIESLQYNYSGMNTSEQRQLKLLQGRRNISAVANSSIFKEIASLGSKLQGMHGTAKVCMEQNVCMKEKDIARVFETSRDYYLLQSLWVAYRNESGRKIRDTYTRFVELVNEKARFRGYKDSGEDWRSVYESDTFLGDMARLFEEVRPLYEHLHAYVRRKLKGFYGEDKFPKSGHIPAHLLGNIYAQYWDTIEDIVRPFKDKPSMDVTPEMIRQNYTVERIFRTSENFFVSLGFDPMIPNFWDLSMLVQPNVSERNVVCSPVAWDLYNKSDYRMSMCTEVTQKNLWIVHHEMGHIVYFMQYEDQPNYFRQGANPGFHEAVGDLIALSAERQEHLVKLGLLKEVNHDYESDINFLMYRSLQRVSFLPFGYLIDAWRWSVFSGTTTNDTYNKDWWKLRCGLQGVSPPVERSEYDFDPGAKFHVPYNVPYIRYFFAYIAQFQFHKALCKTACHKGPLYKCNIYNNAAAGKKLRDMMKLGYSEPWPEAMYRLTGQRTLSSAPMLEYFKPLLDYLIKANGPDVGWSRSECG